MNFAEKLHQIIEHFNLSSSDFADKISVQRSTISHLLANRNKPSLDFILKVQEHFPDINLHWLVGLSDVFLNTEITQQNTNPTPLNTLPLDEKMPEEHTPTPQNTSSEIPSLPTPSPNSKNIEQIILCYTDGTFQIYKNDTPTR